jgi:hypothetical protein
MDCHELNIGLTDVITADDISVFARCSLRFRKVFCSGRKDMGPERRPRLADRRQ